jgi:small GTP-binding protein
LLLEKHRESKAIILEKLERLADIADAVGMDSLARDIRHERLAKLENERFHLVVLGEFNHGKSTFVNAMLGTELLPTGITPTTAALNHVVYSETPTAMVLTKEGNTIDLPPAEVGEWLTVAGDKYENVQRVEIGFPSELLEGNITLVDTPGVNDLNEQRADITYGYVPRADAVIFLLDASQALKDSEREFLSSHVLEGSKDRLIFVLGKIDLLSEAEQDAVITYVKSGLKKLVDDPAVFPLSAKAWLDTRDPECGFPELLTYMERFLDTDRSQIVLDNAAVDAERTAALVQQNLGIKMHALGLDMDDLEKRVDDVRTQLVASKRQIDDLHVRIKAEIEAIKSQAQLALTDFAQRFAKVIPHEIDRVDANDLKQYLGPFVQDKFKEWSEMQGLRVSRSLEKLAEEVITITNENVAEAFHTLSSRLGPSQTKVSIDTDSFMYDLGVYAVGALGTTVFLFVNTLAGGLLTLAAPVLAIVVKSKVSGDIKEQAKERAPGVILTAGEAMAPYFDECIDDFGERLRNFVTSAGVNLYKGITEVLEKTVQQRHDAHDAIAPLVQEVRDHSLEVAQLRIDLGKAREAIWADRGGTPGSQSDEPVVPEEMPMRQGPPPIPDDAGNIEAADIISEEDEETVPPPPDDETRKDLN